MAKAIWKNTTLAESDTYEVVEDNGGVSENHGDDKTNKDAAWYYPETKEAANNIRDHVAFWRGVEVTE